MKAVVAGGTGFIGGFLLDLLEDDDRFDEVHVISRRPVDLPSKCILHVADDMLEVSLPTPMDVAFCALGTTIGTAGSQEAFYRVDHDLVIDFAKLVSGAGCKRFILVSSVGADAHSSTFYLKVKGETEQDLEAIGFDSLTILRPSMLMGERKEFRLGEWIGKGAMKLFDPLMAGPLAKYRGIHGRDVAKAMVRVASSSENKTEVLEGEGLQR